MFENLTGKLQQALRKISGQGIMSESNISEATQEIRSALIDADVNYNVINEFVEDVKREALGAEVIQTVTPGQQFIKVVYDKLVSMMGEAAAPLELKKSPSVIMMIGLHGSGKTTSSAKIAAMLRKQNRRPLLVAADIYRPAAIDQLEILAREIEIPVYSDRNSSSVADIALSALKRARELNCDTVIVDTAGRLQIDQQMISELVSLKQSVSPDEILLVADAALGQQAVSVVDSFNKALGISGMILTKLDGDARGGSALSMRKVTGCPIKFVGVGEKIADLDVFHPDRMASRILGMGDIVSLVEKAAEEIDRKEAEKLRDKLMSKDFDLDDFLTQLRQMKKIGGIDSILKMLPGGAQLSATPGFDASALVGMEAMISSMTPKERANPEIIDFSRKKRITRGSARSIQELNELLTQFQTMQKILRQTSLIKKLMSGSLLPSLGAGMGSLKRGSNYTPPKKKKRRR